MSSGFTFGANTPGFGQTASFGAPQPLNLTATNPGAPPAFGSTVAGTGAKAFNFSAPQATAAPNTFGGFSSPASNPGVNLGMPAQNSPAFGALNANPTSQTLNMFGTPTPGATSFGSIAPTLQAPTASTFGAPAKTTGVSFGTSTFGTAAPASSGLSFGAPLTGFAAPTSTTGGGLNFATPPATGGGLSFGAPASTAGGLSFGAQAPTASAGLAFGAPASTAGGLTFAAPATTQTGVTFGNLTQSTLPPASNTLTFGGPPVPSISSTFGTTAPTSTTLQFPSASKPSPFNAPTTAATATSLFPSAVSAPGTAPTLSLGTSTPNFGSIPISAPNASLNFVATKPTVPISTLGLGLPKLPATSALGFTGLTAATTATTAAVEPKVGLGGVSVTPPKQPNLNQAGQVEIAPREQALPNELLMSVEQFKKYLQEQKTTMSEISRSSILDLKKIETDIERVNVKIGEMENELQKNKMAAEKLKLDSSKGLKHAELAQRTFNTPSGMQYDNTAPLAYFIELTDNFERQMQVLRVHIENINKSVFNSKSSPALTSEDLAIGMRRLHETFVALAGRLQPIHNQVELQKEEYLNMRKRVLKDHTNVFENKSKELEALEVVLENISNQSPVILTGPTPFNSLSNSHAQILAQNQQPPPPAYPSTSGGAPIPGFSLPKPSTIPLFGNISNSNLNFNSSNTSFQLQKPPIGNKRGKS